MSDFLDSKLQEYANRLGCTIEELPTVLDQLEKETSHHGTATEQN